MAFEDEKIIETPVPNLILTNYRIRKELNKTMSSFMLEDLSYCSLEYKDKPIWLVIAILFFIIGIGVWGFVPHHFGVIEMLLFGILAAIIPFVIYLASRKLFLVFSSSGGSINIVVRNKKYEAIRTFINKVEEIKCERIKLMK
jgi:hypothetical protein